MTPTEIISQYIPLSDSDRKLIDDGFKKEQIAKGDFLLREGGYAKQLYFVENGYVRSFYRKEDGTEKTHWIYSNDEFVTSWYSFFTEKPSFENLQAISEASVYSISTHSYQKLYSDCEGFNTFINSYYQNLLAELDYLSKVFGQLSAKEKYEFLLGNHPELVRDVKLGYLASLLDISPETLSRVRRKI